MRNTLLWGALLSVSALRAQPAAAPEPKGSIEGRVVNALSGEGLRKVSLTLTATRGKDKTATAQSDDNGRFAFRDLAPGGYRLSGERNGFLRQEYGARLNPELRRGSGACAWPGDQGPRRSNCRPTPSSPAACSTRTGSPCPTSW